jgi:hypothetical protein
VSRPRFEPRIFRIQVRELTLNLTVRLPDIAVVLGRKSYPCNRPWRPIGLWDVEAPTFSRQSAHRWAVRSVSRAGRSLPPRRFLALIFVIGWVDPRVLLRLERLGQLKKSSDHIEKQTRDFPACSIVPQQTTLPRVPRYNRTASKSQSANYICKQNR